MLTHLINAVHVLKRNPVITDYFRKVKHVPLIDSRQEVIKKTKACDSGRWCSTTDRWTVNAERCTARRQVGHKATRRLVNCWRATMELITFHTADSTAHCALLRDEAAINCVLCKNRRNQNVWIAPEIGSEIWNVLGSVDVKFISLLPII